MDDFLKDRVFLDAFDNLPVKNQFVKLTVLSWNEEPLSEIQGKVVSGNLNLNGSSSLRRTANLTIFAEEKENDLSQIDTDLSINRKIKLEIGFENTVPPYIYLAYNEQSQRLVENQIDYRDLYGDMIWFPLGIYVIFDPNISHSTNGVSITLTLKDKMCLLNGDAGGKLPASTEFHLREQEDEDGIVTVDAPIIRQIIQECVQHLGGEDPARVIIADLDDRLRQVVRWMSDDPLYYAQAPVTSIDNVGQSKYFLDYDEAVRWAAGVSSANAYDDLSDSAKSEAAAAVTIISYGQEAGFIMTDFIYPGELIGDAGETITSVLDKIISILGNYEYFYDVYGNFRFQEIKNYLNITYTTQMLKNKTQYSDAEANYISNMTGVRSENEIDYSVDITGNERAAYTFAGSKLISSFANAPKYSNVKNDFVVWGVRTAADGSTKIPIRYHLAIDKRPEMQWDESASEWYYQDHEHITFYTDEYDVKRAKVHLSTTDASSEGGETVRTYDWREEMYFQGIEASSTGSDYPYYFTELVSEWPKLWDFDNHKFKQTVGYNPAGIDFFLDILDENSEVGKYSVNNIGRRSEVVSDDSINCVFEQEVPDVVFISTAQGPEEMEYIRAECDAIGQEYIQVDESIYNLLSIGGKQNSCYQRVCEMLYQFTNMNNSITLQTIPIYYLEPNTRINVQDPASGIYGDFVIQTISLPLTVAGNMNITANKALQKI